MKGILGISLSLYIGLLATFPGAALAASLDETVQYGRQLFMTGSFDGNGRSCNSCHRGGGTEMGKLPNGNPIPSLGNAAAIFPRYNLRIGTVLTLQDQVHNCIAGAIEGTSPAYDSREMVALISYLTSLAQGKAINMGGKPQ